MFIGNKYYVLSAQHEKVAPIYQEKANSSTNYYTHIVDDENGMRYGMRESSVRRRISKAEIKNVFTSRG